MMDKELMRRYNGQRFNVIYVSGVPILEDGTGEFIVSENADDMHVTVEELCGCGPDGIELEMLVAPEQVAEAWLNWPSMEVLIKILETGNAND
jgi:hypothetical protein